MSPLREADKATVTEFLSFPRVRIGTHFEPLGANARPRGWSYVMDVSSMLMTQAGSSSSTAQRKSAKNDSTDSPMSSRTPFDRWVTARDTMSTD
jgi:hypothetical protein